MTNSSSITKKQYKYPKERRKHLRVPLGELISGFKLNEEYINQSLEMVNISVAGICFKTMHKIEENDVVEIYVKIPDSISIPITARVVWRGLTDETFVYGCQIIAMSGLYSDVINDYVRRISAAAGKKQL